MTMPYPLRAFFSPEEPLGFPVINGITPEIGFNRCGFCPCMPGTWEYEVLDGGWPPGLNSLRPIASTTAEKGLMQRSFGDWFGIGGTTPCFYETLIAWFNGAIDNSSPGHTPWQMSYDTYESQSWTMTLVHAIETPGGSVFYAVIYKSAADIMGGRFRCKESNIFLPWNIEIGNTVSSIIDDGWPRIQVAPIYP